MPRQRPRRLPNPRAVLLLALATLCISPGPARAQLHGQTFIVAVDECAGAQVCAEVPSTWSRFDSAPSAVLAIPNRTPFGAAGSTFDHLLTDWFFEGHFLIGISGTSAIVGTALNSLSIGGNPYPPCLHQHTASAGNISANATFIDRPALNGDPNAFLLVQEHGAAPPTETLGVYYAGPVPGRWAVFNQDGSTMTAGRSFWVLDGSCSNVLGAELTVTGCTPVDGGCRLQNPLLDGNPGAVTLVTQRWSSGTAVYNAHPIGVRYDDAVDRWAVFNEDGSAVPANAEFFVGVVLVLFTDNFERGNLFAWSEIEP